MDESAEARPLEGSAAESLSESAEARPPEESGTESPSERLVRLGLSAAISVGAIALAAAHLIWPDEKLDSVTIVLLVVALLPWLGAVFKSIKLPWVEVQYWKQLQLVQERANHLDSRLAAVETQMFLVTGATPEQEALLNESLRVYASYLDALGLRWDAHALPKIIVDPRMGTDGAPGLYFPEENRIMLAPDAVDDATVALRQYTHSVLDSHPHLDELGIWALEDGLADYFVASHLGDPALGSRTAQRRGRRFFRNLAEPVNFDAHFDALAKGRTSWSRPEANPWGNLFWAIRGVVGQRTCDSILAKCWVSTPPGKEFDHFIAQVLESTPEGSRAAVNHVLKHRGLA
jgi:hypothetical protein